jgi:hypothetical protein
VTTSVAAAARIPRQLAEDPYVLHDRQLRGGVRLQDTSRYSDPVWRLAAAQLKEHEVTLVLSFDLVPQRFWDAMKRLFFAMLSAQPPDGEDRPQPTTLRRYFSNITAFLTWLDGRWSQEPGKDRLSMLTGADLEAYLKHLRIRLPKTSNDNARSRSCVRLLWRWRTALGDDALLFDPMFVEGWSTPNLTSRRRENKTDRIPEAVLGPLVGWSLRFVDDFSADILEANRLWHEHRSQKSSAGHPQGGLADRLDAFIAEHVQEGKPLPGFHGRANITAIARSLEVHRASLAHHAHKIHAAVAEVGLAHSGSYPMHLRGHLDGQPWLPSIDTHHAARRGIAVLTRHLQAACWMVIAYLSGMRDSEVKHLRRGCLTIKRDADGNAYRWKITSLAFKGEDDPTGVTATWVVGEPVARAITILEALQSSDNDFLFARLPHGPGCNKGNRGVVTTKTTNEQLNAVVAWVNRYCRENGRIDGIPEIDGHLIRLKTGLFRRTLAWFIARQPGGVIAGALQYRHHSIQMFEGYAGTSESGFRAEVEGEQALSRGSVYLDMVEAHEHLGLAGPAAEEAARRLADFGERARFQGRVVLDDHRLRRIMKRHDPAVYPGDYITCVHDASKALCEKARSGASEDLTTHGGCLPLACRNVALTRGNTQTWARELDQIDSRLDSRPPLPPLLQHRLRQRRQEITDFLGRHTNTKATP